MTNPEPNIKVRVDVTNPGQFFACCGLLEVADRLWPGAEGWFEDDQFCVVRTDGRELSIDAVLDAAIKCDVASVSAPDPKTAAIWLSDPIGIQLDWWLRADGSTNLFKTWAANATSRQMFCKWQKPLSKNRASLNGQPDDLLNLSDRVQGSYGFDSDVGWDALSVGFSLNEHAGLKKLPTRPAVELLGAIGLQRFFPVFKEEEQIVGYATWCVPLGTSVARIAALGSLPVVTTHRMRTRFVYRGSFKGLDRARIIQGAIR